ncbi:MAG: hypothetical protein GY861_16035 [bacterium]|nr:hypothetical protein [bacterium]
MKYYKDIKNTVYIFRNPGKHLVNGKYPPQCINKIHHPDEWLTCEWIFGDSKRSGTLRELTDDEVFTEML